MTHQAQNTEVPLLTPEDSKRIADAAIEAIQDASRRFADMCANIEQTVYIKANSR